MSEARHQDEAGAKLGMWLFLLTELILFGGLFLLYAVYLTHYPKEFMVGGQELNLLFGTANTIILITSSLTAAMAVTATLRHRPRATLFLLGGTILCAAIFMINKYLEWSAKIHHGIFPNSPRLTEGPPGESVFFGLYYLTTGLHGLHVLIGIGVLSWVAILVGKGRVHGNDSVVLENSVLYWHLVDLVWILIFPLYYLLL